MDSERPIAERKTRHPRRGRGDGIAIRAASPGVTQVDRDIVAVYEQLLALRLDLVHGVIPRAERITLTNVDLEYLLAQLDAAIAGARDIVHASGHSQDREAVRGHQDAGPLS